VKISLAIKEFRWRVLLIGITLFFSNSLYAQGKFSFELLPGGAITLPSTLTILQDGYPDIRFKAHYSNDNFIAPVYYCYRISYSLNNSWACELEMNHLKVLLDNRPPEIAEFTITHGYNQIWFNVTRIVKGFTFRAGLGGVLAHPENTIRGIKYDQHLGLFNRGYHLCGVTSQIAVQKKFYFGKHFFLSGEAKFNGAYAKIPVSGGIAHTPVYAFHGLIGAGISF
jgi:hypothetical protein